MRVGVFTIQRIVAGVLCLMASVILIGAPVAAQSIPQDDSNSIYGDTVWYKAEPGGGSGSCSTTASTGGTNLDYAGNPILTQGELKDLANNESTYQQAAQQVGIPWQALAALHYRETDLSTTEPNSRPIAVGVYQITYNQVNIQRYSLNGPNYPADGQKLTSQQFLNQSIDGAKFLKSDGAGLSSQSSSSTVKDSFGLYNGLPPLYAKQAQELGYNPKTQAYEGSPYVMNRADAQRDSTLSTVANSGKWLQYGTGPGGGIGQPSSFYGAYVVYASLASVTLSGDCSTGSVSCNSKGASSTDSNLSQTRQNVVCIAEQELALWNNGTLKPGTDFEKYTLGRPEFWCADFVSWVYNQAGYPFGPAGSEGQNWSIPYVGNLIVPPQDGNKFVYHKEPGYTPKPGDLAIHYSTVYSPPYYHVNIVDTVSPGKIVLIGGDQHGGGSIETNVVNTEIISSPGADDIIGYVGPD